VYGYSGHGYSPAFIPPMPGKLKIFISVRIELAGGGLDYLSLEEYPWIPFSLTVAIVDRLEIPVLRIAIFHFADCAKSRPGAVSPALLKA